VQPMKKKTPLNLHCPERGVGKLGESSNEPPSKKVEDAMDRTAGEGEGGEQLAKKQAKCEKSAANRF